MNNVDAQTRLIVKLVIAVFLVITVFASIRVIDATERGVKLRFGKIIGTLDPGIHLVLPYITNVEKIEVATQKAELEVSAASKDLQDVFTTVAIQFNIEPLTVEQMYSEYRNQVLATELPPAIQDSIKAVTARFNASELVTKRAEVKDGIESVLQDKLAAKYIRITGVSIVNFRFSEQFTIAIEQKVTAEQNAQKAENDLRRVEFEAQQRIEQAKAEAESIRIQAQAITQQGGKDYVQLKAIEKWNGILPTQFVPGSTIPFINLVK